MEKRLLLAVALSIFIIISFQYLGPKPPPRPAALPQTAPAAVSQPAETEMTAPSASNVPVEEKELTAETGKYKITFSSVGGAIKKIQLKDYKDLHNNATLELVSIKNPKEYIAGLSSLSSPSPLDVTSYGIIQSGDLVKCHLTTKDLDITKAYTLHKSNYIIDLQISITNTSAHPRHFNYSIIGGSNLKETDGQDNRFLELLAKINGKVTRLKAPKTGRMTNLGSVDWAALKSKYFSIILKPANTASAQFCEETRDKNIITGVESTGVTLPAGGKIDDKFILYIGPSRPSELAKAECGLEETVDYGFFGIITKALLVVVHLINNVVHSWGVSIILLSIFLNVALFPLTMKSFKSMQKMQELAPQMEKLKKQHKDNPQKLNKEIMELYKKYNINPLSGCLPMLLQMPIFFALYQALMKSIELRGTRFLWIGDLSSPDAIKLPFTLPFIGDKIHLLPLVMVVAMVVQQKISTKSMGAAVTEEQVQQQKMMLIMMPVMFGLIFYNMPSGLVLYWIVNTVLTVVEQGAILKKD